MNKLWMQATAVAGAVLCGTGPAWAELALPSVFGEGMVLQRGAELPVWGQAEPGQPVRVELEGETAEAEADGEGRWSVRLEPREATEPGEALTLRVEAGEERLVLEDVVVGEVWVASGQSNMQWSVAASAGADEAVAQAGDEGLRMFQAERVTAEEPAFTVPGRWETDNSETVSTFSAVGYYFAKRLREELGVPVGIVHTSWGGTPVEAWMSLEALEGSEEGRAWSQRRTEAREAYLERVRQWEDAGEEGDAPGTGHPYEQANHQPAALYHAMIHPFEGYAMRGVIWYQGESNVEDPPAYRVMFADMIEDWRQRWGVGEFPFLFVQLASFDPPHLREEEPAPWAELRAAQTAVLEEVPNTGMAVTTDIGDPNDIHPANKHDVGDRLARWALAKTYGVEGVAHTGPMFRAMSVRNGKAELTFDDAEGLGTRDGQALEGFELKQADGTWVAAEAQVEGQAVMVWSEDVEEPTGVRYAWSNSPMEANLVNEAGLPAVPFREEE